MQQQPFPLQQSFPLGDEFLSKIEQYDVEAVRGLLLRVDENKNSIAQNLLNYIPLGHTNPTLQTPLMKAVLLAEARDHITSKCPREQIINIMIDSIIEQQQDDRQEYLKQHLSRSDSHGRTILILLPLSSHHQRESFFRVVFDIYRKRVEDRQFVISQIEAKDNNGRNLLDALGANNCLQDVDVLKEYFSFITDAGGNALLKKVLCDNLATPFQLTSMYSPNVEGVKFIFKTLYDLGGRALIVQFLRYVDTNMLTLLYHLIRSSNNPELIEFVLSEMALGTGDNKDNNKNDNNNNRDQLFKESVLRPDTQGLYMLDWMFFGSNALPIEFCKKFVSEIRRVCGDESLREQLATSGIHCGHVLSITVSLIDDVRFSKPGKVELLVQLLKEFGLFDEMYMSLQLPERKKLVRLCGIPLSTLNDLKAAKKAAAAAEQAKTKKAKKEVPKKVVKKE